MATTTPNDVPGYALAPPTEQDAITFLARALGADAAVSLWVRTCQDAGVRSGTLAMNDLERAAAGAVEARRGGGG